MSFGRGAVGTVVVSVLLARCQLNDPDGATGLVCSVFFFFRLALLLFFLLFFFNLCIFFIIIYACVCVCGQHENVFIRV